MAHWSHFPQRPAVHHPGMVRTLARLFLLRFLPGRLIPLLTAYEVYRLVRTLQKRGDPVPRPYRTELLESGDELAASPRAVGGGSRQARP